MVKWSSDRDFCAHESGYNVTGALVHCDLAKPKPVIHSTPGGGSLWYELYTSKENASDNSIVSAAPGLPYKLRRRMVNELRKSDNLNSGRRDPVRSASISRMFWTAVLYASVIVMWVAVWWYAGVQYGK